MNSLYSLTLHDVLTEWWNEWQDTSGDDRYLLTSAREFTLIACRTCNVTWIRVLDDKFEYALEPNGDQYYLDPGDPQVFENMAMILAAVTHDPDFSCGRS